MSQRPAETAAWAAQMDAAGDVASACAASPSAHDVAVMAAYGSSTVENTPAPAIDNGPDPGSVTG